TRSGSFGFGPYLVERRRGERTDGRGATAIARFGRWTGHFRVARSFDDQPAGRDQARDLGVPEIAEEPPDVTVNRLRPDGVTGLEVAADQRGRDPWIERGRVEC